MTSNTGKSITSMQYIFIISGIQVSVSILSLPRDLADAAGTDGWIAIPIGYILSVAAGFIIVKVMQNAPEDTIFDLLSRLMGAWAGKCFALLLGVYFLSFMYDSLNRAILITKDWLLPNTQPYLLMILLLVPTYIVAKHGPQILGRYSEFVFFLSIWIPFIYLFTLENAHGLHLLPLFKEGVLPVLSAVPAMLYPSLGMVTTFILYPHLKNKEKAPINLLISNSLTMLIYLYITIICFVYFSPDEITLYNEPIVSILKSIEFRFIERIEVPFIAFYLFIFSLAWIPSAYIAAFCISWISGKKDVALPLQIFCIVITVSSFFFLPTFNQNDRLGLWIGWLGISIEYVFPLCLLVYIILNKHFQQRTAL
ncbi:GerAB/ArcD/ProY family transporter [Paenibacillus prosopidis]|uniref:Spore germination protein (Amino acid permease) n=1 Tax=Paenibacillus prosopidis TaxID=630520 RepID=A0A368VW45_9BACL|nr:endospore germination permease [Paenibacillus prosopidis]RCW45477.1 spore germination protein (amino acid permease) [Paenibacillus prosopidis]